MKLLFEGHTFSQDYGGISRMWSRILPLLVDENPDIEVALALRLYRTRSAPQHSKIRRITHIEDTRIVGLAPFFQKLTEHRIRRFGPDLFQAMSYATSPVAGIPTVQCVYDCMHEAFPAVTGNPAYSLRKRKAIQDADHIIAISGATRDDVSAFFGIPSERISIVHLAADSYFFQDPAPEGDLTVRQHAMGISKPYFLYVGNRGNYKNFFTLLHAFKVSGLAGAFELVAVGGEPELRHTENEFVIKSRIETNVRFLPKVDDNMLRDLYQGATAFVYPSLKEGFGIPIIEAMASGCPVIASDIPVFREIGVPPSFSFDPHDHEDLARVLIRCVEQLDQRAQNIQWGKDVAAQYSWPKSAARIAELYSQLV